VSRDRENLTTATIWHLIWLHRSDIIKSWDLWIAVIGGILMMLFHPKPELVVSFASSAVGVSSTVIGIVLAALAIMTAFLDRRYVSVLEKAGHGLATEIFSFRYPAAVAVVSVIFSALLIITQDECWYQTALPWLLFFATFFFLYTLFITLNLVASIGGHMMNRSSQMTSETDEGEI
jgi:hypothetical protein